MNHLPFFKYQATGNDFILVDDRHDDFQPEPHVELLCDRRFGIGSDGLIVIRQSSEADFEMVYYNPDGSQSLCGNGSRCAVKFAEKLGIVSGDCSFMAFDGLHYAELSAYDTVRLQMKDVQNVSVLEDGIFLDTGSPHLIRFVYDIEEVEVVRQGREIRNNTVFREKGVNVNFVELGNQVIKVRTYERGVENETLSCGTGVTAAALASFGKGQHSPVKIITKGGSLEVSFEGDEKNGFSEIYLTGPAKEVFQGTVTLNE